MVLRTCAEGACLLVHGRVHVCHVHGHMADLRATHGGAHQRVRKVDRIAAEDLGAQCEAIVCAVFGAMPVNDQWQAGCAYVHANSQIRCAHMTGTQDMSQARPIHRSTPLQGLARRHLLWFLSDRRQVRHP